MENNRLVPSTKPQPFILLFTTIIRVFCVNYHNATIPFCTSGTVSLFSLRLFIFPSISYLFFIIWSILFWQSLDIYSLYLCMVLCLFLTVSSLFVCLFLFPSLPPFLGAIAYSTHILYDHRDMVNNPFLS